MAGPARRDAGFGLSPSALLKCVVYLLLCASACSGFAVHKRHPHRGHPHHGLHHHGQQQQHDPAAPKAAPKVAATHDALLEAMRAADLSDVAWGSGDHDVGEGVPLFMKMLLRETETGDIFRDHNQPVAPPVPGSSGSNTTLASCLQPSRVSVGRAGEVLVEFPRAGGDALTGWWLVLALQQGLDAAADANLAVYLSGSEERPHDVQLLAEHPLPQAAFVAVDVTKAVNASSHSWTRFMVAVKSASAPSAGSSQDTLGTAATVLEVAGWERGPLLVGALDWGHAAAGATDDAGLRVWKDVPEDVLHPPRSRTRRRSHRRTTSTTTEGPAAFGSAENPLKSAAKAGLGAGGGEQEDAEEYCHLEAWSVSVADLGWDFISQPRMLDINFCVGRCPTLLLDGHFNASTNAIARSGIKSTRGVEAAGNIPDAQCVPIRYRPIALLIKQRSGQVDLFTSNDLSADRCGCR